MTIQEILTAIQAAYDNQAEFWAAQNWPDGTNTLIQQNNADFYRNRCQENLAKGTATWTDIALQDSFAAFAATNETDLRQHLFALATGCIGWIACIDRRNAPAPTPAPSPTEEPTP